MGSACSRRCGRSSETPESSSDAPTSEHEYSDLLRSESDLLSSEPSSESIASESTPSWVVNPHVCWRHPALRIFVAVLIMVQDFLLYGEDPINDSHVELNMPGFGEIYGLLIQWPSNGSLIALRISLIVVILVIFLVFSYKVIHHCLLRDCFGLSMFEGHKGTFFIMGCWTAPALYAAALAYNFLAPQVQSDAALLVPYPGLEMRMFCKALQCWSVFLDIISIVMIFDTVLQDQTHYPDFLPGFKNFWNASCGGWVRIIGVWLLVVGMASASTFGVFMTGHERGMIKWTENLVLGNWTETQRAVFLSWVLFCDILCVVQDWEFPTFSDETEVMVAGTFLKELSCSCLARFSDMLHLRITGKWFTYGPLLCVIGADLFSLKNQIMYTPEAYGQYTDPTGGLWGITNYADLDEIYTNGILERPELLTWSARRGNATLGTAATDVYLNARYLDSSLDYYGALPGFLCLLAFVIMVVDGQCTINSLKAHAKKVRTRAGGAAARLMFRNSP